MGKLHDSLQKQLKTEYKQDAEDCIKIYNKLSEMNNGHIWDSQWKPLVDKIFKDFSSDEKKFKPTNMGYIFLKGIE